MLKQPILIVSHSDCVNLATQIYSSITDRKKVHMIIIPLADFDPLRIKEKYDELVTVYQIETIIIVDKGDDCLVLGYEPNMKASTEKLISICIIGSLKVKSYILVKRVSQDELIENNLKYFKNEELLKANISHYTDRSIYLFDLNSILDNSLLVEDIILLEQDIDKIDDYIIEQNDKLSMIYMSMERSYSELFEIFTYKNISIGYNEFDKELCDKCTSNTKAVYDVFKGGYATAMGEDINNIYYHRRYCDICFNKAITTQSCYDNYTDIRIYKDRKLDIINTLFMLEDRI